VNFSLLFVTLLQHFTSLVLIDARILMHQSLYYLRVNISELGAAAVFLTSVSGDSIKVRAMLSYSMITGFFSSVTRFELDPSRLCVVNEARVLKLPGARLQRLATCWPFSSPELTILSRKEMKFSGSAGISTIALHSS